jgi:hypothetical protein
MIILAILNILYYNKILIIIIIICILDTIDDEYLN